MPEPYILPTHDTFTEWVNDVKAAGGVVTVIPKGLSRGAYAARFPNVDGLPPASYVYVKAPVAVLLWQFGQLTEDEINLLEGDMVQWVEDAGSAVVDTIADAIEMLGKAAGKAAGAAVSGWWWLLIPAGFLAWTIYGPRRAK